MVKPRLQYVVKLSLPHKKANSQLKSCKKATTSGLYLFCGWTKLLFYLKAMDHLSSHTVLMMS